MGIPACALDLKKMRLVHGPLLADLIRRVQIKLRWCGLMMNRFGSFSRFPHHVRRVRLGVQVRSPRVSWANDTVFNEDMNKMKISCECPLPGEAGLMKRAKSPSPSPTKTNDDADDQDSSGSSSQPQTRQSRDSKLRALAERLFPGPFSRRGTKVRSRTSRDLLDVAKSCHQHETKYRQRMLNLA